MKKDRRVFMQTISAGALSAALGSLGLAGSRKAGSAGTPGNRPPNREEEALANMQKYGSCCSGVLATFSPELGINKEKSAALGRGMAGGIGGLGNVCGAVSGAVMVIGLKMTSKDNVTDKAAVFKTMEAAKKFCSEFEARNGSIQCRELLGYDISTPEGQEAAMKNQDGYSKCPGFVQGAVTILEDMFNSRETKK